MSEKLLIFNGINGATGDYGLPPMTGAELATFIRGEGKPENLNELRSRYKSKTEANLGVKEGVDPKKLDEAGWGVIFAHDADPAVKEALTDLIALRKEQAGDHFRLYEGAGRLPPRQGHQVQLPGTPWRRPWPGRSRRRSPTTC